MAHANYDPDRNDVIVFTVWTEKELLRQVPGARWDAHDKAWRLPAAWASLVILRGVLGERLTVGDALTKWAWRLRRDRVDPALELRDRLEPSLTWPEPNVDPNLYGFQVAGVQFMDAAGSGLLGDEMGCGKTPMTLSLLNHVKGLPALVICPNSVKFHWAREAARWLPKATSYVVDGGAVARRKLLKRALADPTALVIINTESVRLFSRLAPYGSVRLKRCRECDPRHGEEGLTASRCHVHRKELNDFEFHTVVLDEAHRIKDPQAQQTRAIWHVGHAAGVRRRWALTGTPIANDPSDLWSIMHFVAPEDFPTRSAFVDRFCLTSWNAFGGLDVVGIRPDTRAEFFRVLDPRFRRVLKAVVLPQLPPKVREVRYVDMTTQQARVYRELEERLVTRTEDGQLLVARGQLAAQTRLMQLAAATVTIEKPDPDDVNTWQVTLREPAPKLDALEDVLAELGVTSRFHVGPPVLIAAELKALLALASERLTKLGVMHALFTGDVAPVDRDRALEALREGRIRALLFTGKAGGVGLDMSVSDTLINLQRSWSLVDEKQKEDRPHRPGAERHECVRIIDVITRGTVEETQVTRLHEKLQRLDEITRDRATLLREGVVDATDEERLRTLGVEEERLLSSFIGDAS